MSEEKQNKSLNKNCEFPGLSNILNGLIVDDPQNITTNEFYGANIIASAKSLSQEIENLQPMALSQSDTSFSHISLNPSDSIELAEDLYDKALSSLNSAPEKELMKDENDRSVIYKSLREIIKQINKQFKPFFPWVYMFMIYKDGAKRRVFHVMRSFPVIRLNIDDNDTIYCDCSWQGTNKDQFYKTLEPKKTDNELKLDSSIGNWDKIKKSKFKGHTPKNYYEKRFESNEYPAKSWFRMHDVRHVFIYDWGFEIATASPIDFVVMKRKDFLMALSQSPAGESGSLTSELLMDSNDLSVIEQTSLDLFMTYDMVLPSTLCDIKYFRGQWDYADQEAKSKEVDAWLLDGYRKTKAEINVGQEVNPNIML